MLAAVAAHGSASYLEADFTYETNDLTGQFTDQSVGINIVEWRWTFGDRNYSYLRNPVHTFPGYGTFNVTLTVINANGELHSAAHDVELTPGAPSPYITAAFLIPLILVMVGLVAVGATKNAYVRLGSVVVLIMGVFFLVA